MINREDGVLVQGGPWRELRIHGDSVVVWRYWPASEGEVAFWEEVETFGGVVYHLAALLNERAAPAPQGGTEGLVRRVLLRAGLAALDWVTDIGECLFCNFDATGRHGEDCIFAELTAAPPPPPGTPPPLGEGPPKCDQCDTPAWPYTLPGLPAVVLMKCAHHQEEWHRSVARAWWLIDPHAMLDVLRSASALLPPRQAPAVVPKVEYAHGCTHLTPGCCKDRKVCTHGVACTHGSCCFGCWKARCPEDVGLWPRVCDVTGLYVSRCVHCGAEPLNAGVAVVPKDGEGEACGACEGTGCSEHGYRDCTDCGGTGRKKSKPTEAAPETCELVGCNRQPGHRHEAGGPADAKQAAPETPGKEPDRG